MVSRLLTVPLLALLALGCAAPTEDEGEGAAAMAEGRGSTDAAAKGAAQLAERLHRGDAAIAHVSVLTDEGESVLLPSTNASVASWSLQSLVDGAAEGALGRGFLLQPQGEGVPSGSFVVVLGDGSHVAARAVYVPDEAKDAAGWAKTLLDASEADARAFTASRTDVKIQGVGTVLAKEAWHLVVRLLPGSVDRALAERAAASLARSEARMTTDAALWKDFASHFTSVTDRWALDRMASAIKQTRKALGERRVVLVDSNLKGKPCLGSAGMVGVSGCPAMVTKIVTALDAKLTNQNVALAVPIGAEISPVALLWAVEKRVPIVFTSGGGMDAVATMRALAHRARRDGNEALAVRLEAAAADPAQSSLVTILDTYSVTLRTDAVYPQWEAASLRDSHDQMTPLWALADEALSVDFAGRGRSVFANFLGYFQTHTRVEVAF